MKWCRNNRTPVAVARALPVVGASLDRIGMFENVDDFIWLRCVSTMENKAGLSTFLKWQPIFIDKNMGPELYSDSSWFYSKRLKGTESVAKKKMVILGEALATQGYCRISARKNLVARIDVENWAEVLAGHFDKTLHEMFTEILAKPGYYEDLFRREWSKDRLDVSLTTARTVPSSFQCAVGYEEKDQDAN